MDTRAEIANRVRTIIVEHPGVKAEEVQDQAAMAGDLGADSLEISQLAMVFEDEFDIYITDETLEKLVTVADVIDFIVFFNKAAGTKP